MSEKPNVPYLRKKRKLSHDDWDTSMTPEALISDQWSTRPTSATVIVSHTHTPTMCLTPLRSPPQHIVPSAKMESRIDSRTNSTWRRQRRRPESRPSASLLTFSYLLYSLSLLVLVFLSASVNARHYVAPGACTWTHVSPLISSTSSSSRDIHRLKSSSSASPSEFDFSLRCSVSVLTPFTLNLSQIEPDRTVQLAIGCYGGDQQSHDESTLKPDRASGLAPFEHLRALTSLTIEECKFENLPADSFRGLHSLKNLTVRSAIGQKPFLIAMDSFRPVEPHLEYLDLGANHLAALPTDFFCPFINLRSLNLTRNRLLELSSLGLIDPATGLVCLKELTALDLSSNLFEFVPEQRGVATLVNLQVLNFSSNRLSEIAELAFSGLRRLNVLDLSGNKLRTLPALMFLNSDELRELRLANNQLVSLPGGIFKLLSRLQVLDLSGNQIQSETLTSETFVDLTRLVRLYLSRNRLRRLSVSLFQNMFSLQELSLDGNELELIEEGTFATLYNLHTLRLGHNRLRTLPDGVLPEMSVLAELFLNHNQLEHVHEDAFKNCSNLQHLDLSANRLTTLPIALRALRSLRSLVLSGNRVTTLTDAGPLSHTPSLERLDLSSNYLVNITRAALRPMSASLQELRLDGNRLRTLDKYVFDDLRSTLRRLRLDRNEFTDVSTSLGNLKHLGRLDHLNVSRNQIAWFDYIVLPAGLRSLDLSHNRIEQLGNAHTELKLQGKLRLEELDVAHNLLREIVNTSIPNSIRRLSLHSNRIEKIEPTFVDKHNITFVDLRNNSLRHIDINALRLNVQRPTSSYFLLNRPDSGSDSDLLPPPVFLISGNPYTCDCNMEWLQRVHQLVGGPGSSSISSYPRIGDLDDIKCELSFTRQSSAFTALALDGQRPSPPAQISLMQANSSNFLCRYRSHCFSVCHCCDYDACDCEMTCPENCSCYHDQTWSTNIVDCSGASYREVPARIPMDASAIYLDGNQLYTLGAHAFLGRKNLRVLHLNNSKIETLVNRSFNGVVYLEELHLEHNQLSRLNDYDFEGLYYLTTLHLEYNRISYIHENTFTSLRSLQTLRLDHNQLTSFAGWFTPTGLLGDGFDPSSPILTAPQAVAGHTRYLSISLASNPWSCESCPSISAMYDTLRAVSLQLHITDALEVRCILGASQAGINLLRSMREIEDTVLMSRCNLSSIPTHYLLPPTVTSPSTNFITNEPHPPVAAPPPNYQPGNGGFSDGRNDIPTRFDDSNNRQDPSDTIETNYFPVDQINPNYPSSDLPSGPSGTAGGIRDEQQNVPSSSWTQALGGNLIAIASIFVAVVALLGLLFAGIRRKQDIQLWFYGRYGVRLFEAPGCLCLGCKGGTDSRNGRNGAFSDHYTRDSEKLFDAFVIYARPDESFVTQQLAAELECGYPPYRLCLRYRDLPAPPTSSSSPVVDVNQQSPPPTSKDHGYAFDAVTQAIECSRRTLVVISESFLQSDWCKFELKAAHQETLSSCKTHRLIVVLVPNISPTRNHQSPYLPTATKSAEMLLQRLDSETKACIRGVTVLNWGERRFWEKLKFSMPSASPGPVCSSDKGRTSTVIVANSGGYPTLAPSSLSSSSSLARSSVLYDTSQPIYYQQHHYHYAQLPPPSSGSASLHKSSSLSIFKQPNGNSHHHQANNNNNHTGTLRNPFTSKPLPPPPNQPLPPLPLVSSHFGPMVQIPQQHGSLMDSSNTTPPTYATCSDFGGEYEATTNGNESTFGINLNNNHQPHSLHSTPQHHQMMQQHQQQHSAATLHSGRSRAGLVGVPGHPQFYHSSRRAPL